MVAVRRDALPVQDKIDVHNTTILPTPTRRISWGAIIAGAVIALVTMFALYMMGLSIGAANINPATDINPLEGGLGTGTVVWLAASTLIGLFLGGVVAGRMSGVSHEEDGILHGLVSWGVVTVVTLLMITTTIGSVVNGITGALSSIASATGQAATEVAPEVARAIGVQDSALLAIQDEARGFFAPVVTGTDAEGQPIVNADAPRTLEQVQLSREIAAFLARNPETITDTERDELAAAIAASTTLSQQEARTRIDQWEAAYMDIRVEAEETARQVAQAATDVTTVLAGAIFAMMVAGAFAAGAGGLIGTDNHRRGEIVEFADAPQTVRAPVTS